MPDWSLYRACQVCKALLGQPCGQMSGRRGDVQVWTPADRPHRPRKLRTGYARTGVDRG